ncbi:MAG: EamA family transporter, partial [Chloroflexota bacterium]
MQLSEDKQKNSSIRLGTMMVFFSAILAGLRPLFARMIDGQGLNSTVIALYQILFGAVVFGGIGFAQFERVRASIRPIMIAIAGGVGMGIGTIAYFEALTRLPISIVTAIYFTSPAFVILLTSIIQRQLPSLLGFLA